MRIAIDATFLGAHRGGDETFVRGLLAGLAARRSADDTFPLLLADGVAAPNELGGDPAFDVHHLRPRRGPVHFATSLPRALRAVAADGPLDLAVSVTHAPLRPGTPSALVLGDLSFLHRPGDYPRATALRLRTLVPLHLRRARVVLVPSEFTRADVLARFELDPAAVRVVPNRVLAPEPVSADVASSLAARGAGGPYLLYLGNLHPRKNVARLIRAFRTVRAGDPALRGHRLVIAGGRWFRGNQESDAAAGDPNVVFLGRVSDPERAALLAGADALGYVSLFEGFGLPPLEAMACGVPVLSSNVTSLPEVTGGAALLVDPSTDAAVAEGVHRILADAALRARLRADGPPRAAVFDAHRVGDAALTAFAAGLGSSVPVPSLDRFHR